MSILDSRSSSVNSEHIPAVTDQFADPTDYSPPDGPTAEDYGDYARWLAETDARDYDLLDGLLGDEQDHVEALTVAEYLRRRAEAGARDEAERWNGHPG